MCIQLILISQLSIEAVAMFLGLTVNTFIVIQDWDIRSGLGSILKDFTTSFQLSENTPAEFNSLFI